MNNKSFDKLFDGSDPDLLPDAQHTPEPDEEMMELGMAHVAERLYKAEQQRDIYAEDVRILEQKIVQAEKERDELRAEAEKYHTQLIECKHRWDAMKQQRDELLELLCEARDRMLGSHAPMVRLRERTDAAIAKAKG